MIDFINLGDDDPTKELDLGSISLEKQYTTLTDREKLLVFCKVNGYSRIPPTIERMYTDPYYLGGPKFFDGGSNLFQFWKDSLPKIFPNEVFTSKPFLVLSGAIGIGKSTVSRLCLAMTYARLLCMKNPSKTLGLTPKPLSAVIFHRSEDTAEAEFKKWFLKDVMLESPFFRNTLNPNLKFNIITAGPRGAGGLGSDVCYYLLGEINFWNNQEQARQTLSTALIRMRSRFSDDSMIKVGNFIIDSSAKGNTDATEWFLENTPSDLTWNCKPAHYEVRKNLYKKSNGKTFKVFIGDAKYPPQILPEDYNSEGDLSFDKDKVIEVPIQLKGEYRANLIKSLQDLSGISTGSSDKFFGGSIEHIIKNSIFQNKIPEVITVDFYNKKDKLINHIYPMIEKLPLGSAVWLGLDLSAAQGGDATGISLVSFEGWKDYDGTKMPTVKCWFILAIKNKEGQEVSLFHIFQLIKDLSERYRITVSADQAFSRQILQDCTREGIRNNGRISTDNLPCEPAIYLKNLINLDLISLPVNKRFQREASDLYYDKKGKVDHPKKASISPLFDNPDGKEIGSKDMWDSLASACYSLKISIDEGEEFGFNTGYTKQNQMLTKMTHDPREDSQEVLQGMLESIF